MPESQAETGERPQTASGISALDLTFLKSRRGIILISELVLLLLMFICYSISTAAFMTAPLIFIVITLAFLGTYVMSYPEKMTTISWPCVDFLRASSSAVIFLIVSITSAATSKEDGSASAALFGFLLTGVLVYDAYDSYRAIRSEQYPHIEGAGESQSSNLDVE